MPNQSDSFKTKEINDILPEHNQGLVLIPQLITNNAKDFIHTAKKIKQLGYNEINLNLGCPSGTVVSKNRGSGFLALRKELDLFLDEIFSGSDTSITVKTRLGKDQPEEFYELIEIFNKYPMKELIIHPRIQKDMYKNKPNLMVFKDAVSLSKNPICYNGNIFTARDYTEFAQAFSKVDTIMLGRGLVANPALVLDSKGQKKLDKERLKAFHDMVYEGYQAVSCGEKNVLYKMKELWFYMISMFSNYEKYEKKIKKSERLHDYENVIANLFQEQNILEAGKYSH
jgi:tRNA-dihydrouridine synthase